MNFQKNAWVFTTTIIEIAKELVHQARIKHGETWKIMSLGNLSACYSAEEKYVCSEGKVTLSFLPAQKTESAQATDVGHGRSARCGVVRSLEE